MTLSVSFTNRYLYITSPCICLIARLTQMIGTTKFRADTTWWMVSAEDWLVVEYTTGLICSSLPHLKRFVSDYLPTVIDPSPPGTSPLSRSQGSLPQAHGYMLETRDRAQYRNDVPTVIKTVITRPDEVLATDEEPVSGIKVTRSFEVPEEIQGSPTAREQQVGGINQGGCTHNNAGRSMEHRGTTQERCFRSTTTDVVSDWST